MKKTKRLLVLVLCAALVLSLFGCTQDPTPTEPAPTEPPVLGLYEEALAAVENAPDVILKVTAARTTTVAGQEFSEESSQTLSYVGLGTDALTIHNEDAVSFGGFNTIEYDEVYADGTLYMAVDDTNDSENRYFSGAIENADSRYLPVVLLDASLYAGVSSEVFGTASTLIHFTEPTAAESWALPAGAEMVEAAGSALISEEGKLQRFTYTITYTYGPTQVTLDVESYVSVETAAVEIPANAADYLAVASIDAVRLSDASLCYMAQADWVSSSSIESVLSEAGAVLRNQSVTMDMVYADNDVDAKAVTNLYVSDFSTGETFEMEQEELYVDGKYTAAVDGGEPQAASGVTVNQMYTYVTDMLYLSTISLGYWQDAVLTDLGSTWLVECTFTDALGSDLAENICYTLFGDGDFLNNYASASGTKEVKGYFGVDKYTGLPTSAGITYAGYHTIDGLDYGMTYQIDQSFDIPALGAYHNITEEWLPEEEPETRATPLFYHVTGENGQEMWLLGTIHVGDERTAYLPQEIYDAFAASDALALEFDSEAFEEELENDEALSEKVSAVYYYGDGSTVADHIGTELYDAALPYLKASGSYNMNADYMNPYLWISSIENFYLRQGYSLTSHQGMEARLEELADEQDKEIRSVESGLFQLEMLTGYSDELQKMLLGDVISYDGTSYWQETNELYELWCQGDEAVLREALTDDISELTEEELALYNEYNDAMLIDRNAGMLDVAVDYLESGDVVFYAVGLAHLISGNGLVDTLRDAGYTVELVSYAG